MGNRTGSHLSASYTTGPFNRFTAATGITQTFDANGNTATRTASGVNWTYTWDFENRMAQAASTVATVAYVYDALGRRVKRTEGASVAKFTHDREDVVLDDVAGTLTKYQNGLGIDDKLSVRQGTAANYFLADHLGSTEALTDASGVVAASQAYDGFGNAAFEAFPSRYQFTGREPDPTIGLQFSRARFYDPELGRFTAEDPIGFEGGDFNLYGYVGNSPVNYTDPTGLYPSFWKWNYHKTITERALQGRADPGDIRMLADAQYPHDSATQDPAYAPWHAMARPLQDPEDARREANIFVRNRICTAKELSRRGFQSDAMAYLAQAIHAVQDNASPAHHPFKKAWPDTLWSQMKEYLSPFGHMRNEAFDPGPGSAADAATRAIYDYYNRDIPMPKDFFDNAFDTRGGAGSAGIKYSPYRNRF